MQFIPRLSSTSINNKHLHETRASLRGWKRHRPARSTSNETLCLLGPYWTPHLLPHYLSSVAETPRCNLYLCLSKLYQVSLRWLSACGGDGREHLWLMTRDRRSRPRFRHACDTPSFHQPALTSVDWCLQHLWFDLVVKWGSKGAQRGNDCI